MICPRCKSENVSAYNKRGISKLLQFLNPTISFRCIGCGFNFDRLNKSFLIILVLVVAGVAGGWVFLGNLPIPHKKAPPVNKAAVSSAPPPAVKPSNTKAQTGKPISALPTVASQTKPEDSTPENVPEANTQKTEATVASPKNIPETDAQKTEATVASPVNIPETDAQKTEATVASPGNIPEADVEKTEAPVASGITPQPETALPPKGTAETIQQKNSETGPGNEPAKVNTGAISSTDEQAQTLAAVDPGKNTVTTISGTEDAQTDTQPGDSIKLIGITVQVVNEENQILIHADHPNLEYKYFFLNYPPRMVVDLPGNWEQPKTLSQDMENDFISQIRLWKHEDKLRLTSDLKTDQPVYPIFKKTDQGLLIILK